jgi:hypothetical protein
LWQIIGSPKIVIKCVKWLRSFIVSLQGFGGISAGLCWYLSLQGFGGISAGLCWYLSLQGFVSMSAGLCWYLCRCASVPLWKACTKPTDLVELAIRTSASSASLPKGNKN